MTNFLSELVAVSVMAGQAALAQPAPEAAASPAVRMSNQPTVKAVVGAESVLTVVAELEQTPGNIAVAQNGRIFVTMHPFGEPKGSRVMEIDRATKRATFVTEGWAQPIDAESGSGLSSIIGIKAVKDGSKDGTLWVLDMGQPGKALGPEGNIRVLPKLYSVNPATLAANDVFVLPEEVVRPGSFIQDLAVDVKRNKIYLADCGIGQGFTDTTPAIIVLDLLTREAKRKLEKHPALMPEADAKMIVDGREVLAKNADGTTTAPRVGLNPITISDDGEQVYFGSMHGRTIWRVPAASLASESIGDRQLGERLVNHGAKGVSDGMSIDSAGNIYVTDVNSNAIGVLETGGLYRRFIEDPRLNWPDGLSAGPDGDFYVVVNQLNRHAGLNAGVAENKPPYLIVKFRGLAKGTVGR